jgi:hypothetical protein
VYAGINAVLARDSFYQLAVANVPFVKRYLGRDRGPVPARQIIQNHDLLATRTK